ncbi:MAG: hypothetical protein NDJ92_06150 [Thermoanaerobaculia bacterium]|nr:hypothetical protein [Thermoanaerobaculia bacterium]
MKRMSAAAVLLMCIATSAWAETEAKTCRPCGGLVLGGAAPSVAVPLLIRANATDLSTLDASLFALSTEQEAMSTVVVDIDQAPVTIEQAEELVGTLSARLAAHDDFYAAGIAIRGTSSEIAAYMVRRMAVLIQGRQIASRIVLPVSSPDELAMLATAGASPYYDLVLVDEAARGGVTAWLEANDPSKRVLVVTTPLAVNPLHDIASRFGGSVERVFVGGDPAAAPAIAAMNAELVGDFSVDPSSDGKILDRDVKQVDGAPVVLVRGEDLRTLVVPPGSVDASRIVSISDGGFVSARRISASGSAAYRDVGRREGRYLIGATPSADGYLFALERPAPEETEGVLAEKIQVATEKRLSVEEIIRNHQSYWVYQQTITPRYVAKNQTDLRFSLGPTAERFEVSIAGPHFFDGDRRNDWLWSDFYVNGVKWKYGEFPQLPIVQAEKVTQLPLEINLTNEYRYELAGEEKLDPFDTWVVRFSPPPNAPDGLPLYRGTVWVDKRTYARVRMSMIQLNLSGEVLSNEETTDYAIFDATTSTPISREEASRTTASSLLWLPASITAQQVVSAMSRPVAVERRTAFSDFELQPLDFDGRYRTASDSKKRMVRETAAGLRYLVKDDSGERVVQEGFDTSQLFLLGGLRHDEGQEYPVLPLAGVNYFNSKVRGRDMQTNVFFAGVILSASLADSSFLGTRSAIGLDTFALAIPFENTIFRDGEESEGETVETQPFSMQGRISRPIGSFLNVSATMAATWVGFGEAEDTAPDYVVPTDTWILSPSVGARFDRRGYSLSLSYEYGTRTSWDPWGVAAEYSDGQKDFNKWDVTLAKGFFLPKFQRLGFEVSYLDGKDLDRFSKYELGFFGSQRVRGIRSESVRAESMIIGHVSYGFVLSDLFRLEAFYDAASVDDKASGLDGEIFQGFGFGGQTVAPWGLIIRFDIGKTVGSTRQEGFVGTILFLKLL